MADMTIARLAAAGGVGVETIRYYQRRGLSPSRPGPAPSAATGPADLRRLLFIRRAQAAGFTLDEIGELLALDSGQDRARVRALAAERLAALDAKIAELEAARAALTRLSTGLRRGDEGPVPDPGGVRSLIRRKVTTGSHPNRILPPPFPPDRSPPSTGSLDLPEIEMPRPDVAVARRRDLSLDRLQLGLLGRVGEEGQVATRPARRGRSRDAPRRNRPNRRRARPRIRSSCRTARAAIPAAPASEPRRAPPPPPPRPAEARARHARRSGRAGTPPSRPPSSGSRWSLRAPASRSTGSASRACSARTLIPCAQSALTSASFTSSSLATSSRRIFSRVSASIFFLSFFSICRRVAPPRDSRPYFLGSEALEQHPEAPRRTASS